MTAQKGKFDYHVTKRRESEMLLSARILIEQVSSSSNASDPDSGDDLFESQSWHLPSLTFRMAFSVPAGKL
jgi:hypothetical protein